MSLSTATATTPAGKIVERMTDEERATPDLFFDQDDDALLAFRKFDFLFEVVVCLYHIHAICFDVLRRALKLGSRE